MIALPERRTPATGWWATGALIGAVLLALLVVSENDDRDRRVAAEAKQAESDRLRGGNLVIPLADCPPPAGHNDVLLILITRDGDGRPVETVCRIVSGRGAHRGYSGRSRVPM